jgi:hypothetical protein
MRAIAPGTGSTQIAFAACDGSRQEGMGRCFERGAEPDFENFNCIVIVQVGENCQRLHPQPRDAEPRTLAKAATLRRD